MGNKAFKAASFLIFFDMKFQGIRSKYTGLLYQFVVGLIHDDIEAHAIVALCFEYLKRNFYQIRDENTARSCLENTARKLSLNYINKKANEARHSDTRRTSI